ncbi:hypothetical protein NPIL_398321 [Nephila pilipes]|uniref:Uncharacterized protein n=1 Tax=Nephila pilipes TaxID=299642 RepID=A0A8X6UCC2_NEPPI|nr:hypothetical protein NPIL_398321 [Nephila pilipes]
MSPISEFKKSKQIEILCSRAEIEDFQDKIQKVFSFPVLFICIANFWRASSILTSFAHFGFDVSNGMHLESALILFSSSISIFSIMFVAGQLPIEMDRFRKSFCKNIERREFLGIASDNEKLNRGLYDKSSIVMTGGEILHFRRSTSISVVGAMFACTFLQLPRWH